MHLLASNCSFVFSCFFEADWLMPTTRNQIQAISCPHRCVFFLHETNPIIVRYPVVIEVRYRHILEHCHLDRSMEVWHAFWLLGRLTYAPRNHTRKGGIWVGCILVPFICLWYFVCVYLVYVIVFKRVSFSLTFVVSGEAQFWCALMILDFKID